MDTHDLLDSIDKGLDPFGSNYKQMIYWNLLATYRASSGEVIISDPEAFGRAIEELSGSRAERIEQSIIREVRKTFGLSIQESRNIVSTIQAAKEILVNYSPL